MPARPPSRPPTRPGDGLPPEGEDLPSQDPPPLGEGDRRRRWRGPNGSPLHPYLSVFAARLRVLLQYRAAALAGLVTQCWWGAMRVMVLEAFYRSGPGPQPMTASQSFAYIWLGQAFFTLLPTTADPETARLVRTGDVAYDRLRPLDAHGYWLARTLARRTVQPLMRAVPIWILAGLVLPLVGLGRWGLPPPAGIEAAVLFALSLAAAVLLSATITALMDAAVAATLSDRGVNMIMTPLVLMFSGIVAPLLLYPDPLRLLLFLQPFAGLMDIPSRIYFGQLRGLFALAGLGQQAAWILILWALGRWITGRAMIRLQLQGG